MGAIQTDSLEGSEASLDDGSTANLDKLVQTTQELLDDRVADRDLDTGELKPVQGTNESNRAALQRYCIQFVLLGHFPCKPCTSRTIRFLHVVI